MGLQGLSDKARLHEDGLNRAAVRRAVAVAREDFNVADFLEG
jgi:hypothetical protein